MNTRLNYHIGAQAWYTPNLDRDKGPRDQRLADELRVGRDAYTDDGHEDGCVWEFTIRQVRYTDGRPLALRVEMFDDSWLAYAECDRLFARLAEMSTHAVDDHRKWALSDVIAILDDLGFTDDTPRERS